MLDILSIQTCVRFRISTESGMYEDALYLPVEDALDPQMLETLAQARVDAWTKAVTNTAPAPPPPLEDLEDVLRDLQAQTAATEEKITLQIAAQSDTEAPTVPQRLQVMATGKGIQLTWEPSQDDIALAGYRVYRDGERIAEAARERYTDFEASPAKPATYYVTAFDVAGNESERSEAVQTLEETKVRPADGQRREGKPWRR